MGTCNQNFSLSLYIGWVCAKEGVGRIFVEANGEGIGVHDSSGPVSTLHSWDLYAGCVQWGKDGQAEKRHLPEVRVLGVRCGPSPVERQVFLSCVLAIPSLAWHTRRYQTI